MPPKLTLLEIKKYDQFQCVRCIRCVNLFGKVTSILAGRRLKKGILAGARLKKKKIKKNQKNADKADIA